MTAKSALLGLWAETSIHAGAGSAVDGVDLPIQREGHSGWPCVFGSALKGALRAKAEGLWGKNDSVRLVFGPDSDSDKASEHAGALMVGDARLLLLSVRSLTSHFKWVTCPALLERLQRDAQRLGLSVSYKIPTVANAETAIQVTPSTVDLFLEEYRFTVQAQEIDDIIQALKKISGINDTALKEQLVIVNNDTFSYLSKYATPVTAHIAIENEKKTVKKGALWYEETLPPETVFYCPLSANKARDMNEAIQAQWQAEAILTSVTKTLFANSPYLQIGGNENLGMGWCKVTVTGA